MRNMKRSLFILTIGLLGLSQPAAAAVPDPDVLIKDTVHEVLDIVRSDQEMRSGNQKKLLQLVDAKVLPHFNFERMTKLAVGKSWRTATPEQKTALVAEFRTLLVRTYTKAFTSYRDQIVEVKPANMKAEDTEVTIKTEIIKPGGQQPVLVNYDMEKTDNGWKVYDLTVEGVSLVTSYRGTFADQIKQVGIDGLIATLVEKNRTAAAAAAQAEQAVK